ncbi:hypothetical protein BJV77DRAFT_1067194 [Russula vinacea]|nr:hypothetical protein BJV77DRAFT_1067194 [Russula vinacea]
MSFVEETKQLVINTASSNEALKRNEYNWVVYVQHICEEPSTALQFLALYDVGFVKDVQFHNDGPFQLVLVFSMAIFLFCLHGLKVLWPKGFIQGKWFFGSLISIWTCAHVLFLGVNGLKINSDVANFLRLMTIRLYIWMTPWASSLFLEQFGESHRFLQLFAQYCNVILCVLPAILELMWGSTGFPGTLYRLLFLCFAVGPIWGSFAIIIPPSWVNWFASAREAAYSGVCSAGGKAKAYMLCV